MPSPDYLFNSIINALPDLIFIKNRKSEYMGGNKAFFDFYKKTKEDIIGKTDFDFLSKTQANIFLKSDKDVFETGKIWSAVEWATKPNGELVKFENTKIPLLNNKNKIFGIVGISHDITNRHKYEQELEIAKEKVEESDRIKSSFLASVSSEIRTPVNSITGFSDLLIDPNLTIDQRAEIIDMIKTNSHALIDLVDDIIDFSRLESGQIHIKYSDFDLNSVIKNVYDYGNLKKNQFGKDHMNISFNIGAIEDVFMINSDSFRLRQVLKNLINNMVRFSSSDNIFFGYIVSNEKLIIYVKCDNSSVSDNILNRFSHKKNKHHTLSNVEKTSGITIIIAERVIEILGGQLYIEDEEHNMLNFYFSIPLKQPKVVLKHNKQQDDIVEIPDWSNKTILVAEDEEINFILIEEILKKTNINIIRANNGKEAILKYKENISDIDLILMDIRMPVINGVLASSEILKIDPDAIIIAQTAYVIQEDKERYMEVGIKSVIAKPVESNELYFACNKYLLDN
jgi:PAS domain S-box-containing protein